MTTFDAKLHLMLNDRARLVAAIVPRSTGPTPAPTAGTTGQDRSPVTVPTHAADHVIANLEPLNVYRPGGAVIEVETLKAVCREVLTKPTFNTRQVRQALQRAGAPRGSEFRGADRLLEQLRDMGAIRYNRFKPSLGWDVVNRAEKDERAEPVPLATISQ